jgi:hypothetical protein
MKSWDDVTSGEEKPGYGKELDERDYYQRLMQR